MNLLPATNLIRLSVLCGCRHRISCIYCITLGFGKPVHLQNRRI